MIPLTKGKYTARAASSAADMAAAFALRARCFGVAGGAEDRFDRSATHIVVEQNATGTVAATFRISLFGSGAQITDSYAAQFYNLGALAHFSAPMLELGRFCISPDQADPDILRIAWAALTAHVDASGVEMLFGCSSFAGTQPQIYVDAFALLKARHLAPVRWAPQIKAANVHAYAACLGDKPDLARANAAMPPLLRTYLMMGGWVSDHAVIDLAMDTLHVFTGLEISAIPDARKRLLRALV